MCLPEAAGTVQVLQGGEGAADDLLGRGDDPLERLPLRDCAAGKPHHHAVCEDALYGATVERHQQFLYVSLKSLENTVSDVLS